MHQTKPAFSSRIRSSSLFLFFVIGIVVTTFTPATRVLAQTAPSPAAQQIAAQTGVDVALVTEMLAAGIPSAYINQQLAETFVTEIRPELALPTTEQPVSNVREDATAAAITTIAPAALGNVKLRSCSSHNFPFIFLAVGVDENGLPVTNLTEANFQCLENGVPQTARFQVTPPQSGDNVRLADIIFLIDASGSMVEEIADVRASIAAFTEELVASDIDFRLGLVQFGNRGETNPFLFNNGNLTSNVELFRRMTRAIGIGGGFEPGFLALRMAIQGFNFRPGAQKIFVLISDEDSDDSDQQATLDLLLANNITVHTAVDCAIGTAETDYCNGSSVRGATDGLLFNIVGPYSQILETIAGNTADTYILRYQSSNPNFDGTTRNIECQVITPTIQGSVSCTYLPGAAPKIALTAETLALNQTALADGASPLISVQVTDQVAPFVQAVTLYYRTTRSTSGYSVLAMSDRGNNRYEATIPPVTSPGIDYYITATDGQSLSALPSTDPGQFPFQISVLPNVAPQIIHTPVTNATFRAALTITAEILDTTDRVADAALNWRRAGDLIYRTLPLQHSSDNRYSATIPGTEITGELEYYLRAIDNLGVAATLGTADQPYQVAVTFAESPLIFIPGSAGSRLQQANAATDLWVNLLEPNDRVQQLATWFAQQGHPGAGTALELFYNQRVAMARRLTLDPRSNDYQIDLAAPDVLRTAFGVHPIYATLLNDLETHYPPYRLSDNGPQPGTGCDMAQAAEPNKPRLFVFPYDWRQSNAQNAQRLASYITECVQRYFYPNSKIDIVAHSTGGLLARRYIIDHPDTHNVSKLITVGTPWLGAPEFIKVLETGAWRTITNWAMVPNEQLQDLVETYPAIHEWLPSRAYHTLAGSTYREEGWDINNNGIDSEAYAYADFQRLLDEQRYPTYQPVKSGDTFHSTPRQDSWRGDQNDVAYHYIIGVKSRATTIEQVTAYRVCALSELQCTPLAYYRYQYGSGDGVVPLLSARRAQPATAPDGAKIQLHEIRPTADDNQAADHLTMLQSNTVYDCIAKLLSNEPCAESISPTAGMATTTTATAAAQAGDSYYVDVAGVTFGMITDSAGNRTGMIENGVMIDYAAEANYFTTGGPAFAAVVAAANPYTIAFHTGALPFTAEIREGTAAQTRAATRYRDVQLPPNTLVHIRLQPQSNYRIFYDADNDGRPETELPGLIAGTGAQDTTPPQVAVQSNLGGAQLLVTITAEDSGTGVAAIYYSLDGTTFARYSGPVPVSKTQQLIYAFADDNVGNRSALLGFRLTNRVLLPIISAATQTAR